MKTHLFLDTEFTDLQHPELLSLGLVTADGAEHYAELDFDAPASAAVWRRASSFVRENGVQQQWNLIPGATGTAPDMALRTAAWLREQASRLGAPLLIGHDYATDYELLERCLRDAGQWTSVRELVRPWDITRCTGTFEGHLAADHRYRALSPRGLARHHALADAHALRANYVGFMTGKRVL